MWLFSLILTLHLQELCNSMKRMMIFSFLLQREMGACCALLERVLFFTLTALVISLKWILLFVDTYDHSSLFSEVRGSVTKPLIRRRNSFSHKDVFQPLASCISFVHQPVFSREMYEVQNEQHPTAVFLQFATISAWTLCPGISSTVEPKGGQGGSPTQQVVQMHLYCTDN